MADLVKAAASGDRRKTLEALREELAESIKNCESGRDMAALSKRLMEVLSELDAMPKPKSTSPLQKAKAKAEAEKAARCAD